MILAIEGAYILKAITTADAVKLMEHGNHEFIDTRSIDAYNGWKPVGFHRGGHIPAARSLPYKWINYLDWLEIVEGKGITPTQILTIYGTNDLEVRQVASHFENHGYSNVFIYLDFLTEWVSKTTYPLEQLQRYQQLVSPEWLQSLLKAGSAPEMDQSRYVVCHSHFQNPDDYHTGHISGAIQLDTNWLESTETWNRHDPDILKETLVSLGITSDTTVILYGRFSFPNNDDPFPGSSAGHIGAIRSAFIMLYAGVKDVRVLNGGLQSWTDAGFKLSSEETFPKQVIDFGAHIPNRPSLAVDTPEAKTILANDKANLVSVRSWREFIGEVSGYNYIKPKGRIPGAVFGNCGSDAYHMENYRNPDHTCREYQEVERLWAEVGITPEKRSAFYCGTGWRGSEAFFNAWLMGWPDIAVYDGGWFEWSRDPDNPRETGIPA